MSRYRLGLLARWNTEKRAKISFCFLVFQVFFTPQVAFGCICLLFS